MYYKKDERRLDFLPIGKAIKEARTEMGMTQEELGVILDCTARNVMQIENKGQHPRLNGFFILMTMFEIPVDQFFFPETQTSKSPLRSKIDFMLDSMVEQELIVVQATMEGLVKARELNEEKEEEELILAQIK